MSSRLLAFQSEDHYVLMTQIPEAVTSPFLSFFVNTFGSSSFYRFEFLTEASNFSSSPFLVSLEHFQNYFSYFDFKFVDYRRPECSS